MNDFRLLPDDPRLTAYALGELSGAERAAVEAALHENPALRLVVDEIRATAEQIESALAGEPAAAAPSTAHPLNGVVVKINGHASRTYEGSRLRVSDQVTMDDRPDAYARPHGRTAVVERRRDRRG